MKYFLDDIRDPPDDTWTLERSGIMLEFLIDRHWDYITHISLDHDLAEYDDNGNEVTGYRVASTIERITFECGYCPFDISIHSANLVGIKRINDVIKNIHTFPSQP